MQANITQECTVQPDSFSVGPSFSILTGAANSRRLVANSAQWRIQALEKLSEIGRLPQDGPEWRALRPTPEARLCALALVEHSINERKLDGLPMPFVVATLDRGIGLEWKADSKELHVEVLRDGVVEYLQVDSRHRIAEGTLEIEQEISEVLLWFLS